MKNLLSLMQREWLQYRFGWMMMVLVPLALVVVLLPVGSIDIDRETIEHAGNGLPALVAMVSMAAGMAVIFVIASSASLITVSGLARRDHGDRSVEFWLSMPTTHVQSFAAPLLVHLLLVPMAALGCGLLVGALCSVLAVAKVAGVGAWFGLPWGAMVPAIVSVCLRLAAGVPLAVLWLLPLILLTTLAMAWFRRWGLLIVAVGGTLLVQGLDRFFGQPWLVNLLGGWMHEAGRAMLGKPNGQMNSGDDLLEALKQLPGFAASDFGHALVNLASPLLPAALAVSAACFAGLVLWRRRGAAAAAA